ncbi:MAG: Gfo/Idh/MocA family oxidoreductase [Actinomycetes bacterium]
MRSAAPPPVRWGFLGAGFVASQALAPAVHASPVAVLHAAAARDAERANALEPLGFSADDYWSVVNDDTVDAVYISLANDAHLAWILAALTAGKHVLCEKPITLNASECRVAFDAAQAADRLLVEGAWNQWHPRTRRLDELMRSGTLRQVRSVTAEFTFDGVPDGNYRLDVARGGGALLDVGPYLVRPMATWTNGSWTVEDVDRTLSDRTTDLRTRATLSSSDGARAQVLASFADPEHQQLRLDTANGSAMWGSPAFTSWRQTSSLELSVDGRRWSEKFASCDAYEIMVSEVSRRIRGDEDAFVVTADESVACLQLMDLIDAAARSA